MTEHTNEKAIEAALEDVQFVSPADHEAGYKDVEVEYRSGTKETVRLHAPCRRVTRGLGIALQQSGDPWCVVAACRPAPILGCIPQNFTLDETWLDKLSQGSADLVEVTAFALTFGSEAQKKIQRAAVAVLTDLTRREPSSLSGGAA